MIETINANCLDVLKETAANSQDLIFCDPPYALTNAIATQNSKLFNE